MADRTCRWCDYLASLYGRNLENEVRRFIGQLESTEKVDDATYTYRLEKCMSCKKCHSGICMVCGCVVAARAAKRKMDCPWPDSRMWDACELSEDITVIQT